jgi:hypothetical protein
MCRYPEGPKIYYIAGQGSYSFSFQKKKNALALAPRGQRRGRTLAAASSYLSPFPLPAAAGGRHRAKPARWRWALPYPLVRRLRGAAPAGSGAPRRLQFVQSDGDGRAWRRLPLAEASRSGAGGLYTAAEGNYRRRGPGCGQAGRDLDQASPDLGQAGHGGASAGVSSLQVGGDSDPSPSCIIAGASLGPAGLHPTTVSCRSPDPALLLDSSIREGRAVAFYCRAEVSDWMPQVTGLTGDGTASARPVPVRCGCGGPLGGLRFRPRTDR